MEGEDMPEVTQVIPDSWEIAWMVDTLAWATSNGNSMISSLNYYGRCYDEWAQEGSPEYQAFIGLSEQCKAAKSAIVMFIDAHIDALKILNASENRSEESTHKHTTHSTHYCYSAKTTQRGRDSGTTYDIETVTNSARNSCRAMQALRAMSANGVETRKGRMGRRYGRPEPHRRRTFARD